MISSNQVEKDNYATSRSMSSQEKKLVPTNTDNFSQTSHKNKGLMWSNRIPFSRIATPECKKMQENMPENNQNRNRMEIASKIGGAAPYATNKAIIEYVQCLLGKSTSKPFMDVTPNSSQDFLTVDSPCDQVELDALNKFNTFKQECITSGGYAKRVELNKVFLFFAQFQKVIPQVTSLSFIERIAQGLYDIAKTSEFNILKIKVITCAGLLLNHYLAQVVAQGKQDEIKLCLFEFKGVCATNITSSPKAMAAWEKLRTLISAYEKDYKQKVATYRNDNVVPKILYTNDFILFLQRNTMTKNARNFPYGYQEDVEGLRAIKRPKLTRSASC